MRSVIELNRLDWRTAGFETVRNQVGRLRASVLLLSPQPVRSGTLAGGFGRRRACTRDSRIHGFAFYDFPAR